MKKRTSVEVQEDLFQKFKEESVKSKFSLQKLVDRSIYLYLTDETYKHRLHSQIDINIK